MIQTRADLKPQRLIKVLDLLIDSTLGSEINSAYLKKFKWLAAIFARQTSQLSDQKELICIDTSLDRLEDGLNSLFEIAIHLTDRATDSKAMLALFTILISPRNFTIEKHREKAKLFLEEMLKIALVKTNYDNLSQE